MICDAGQRDAIFTRIPNGSDILIDGEPDDSVLACLGKYMPFWDRTSEVMILTHPHADHLTGLTTVLNHYRVLSFATENLKNNKYGHLTTFILDLLRSKNIKILRTDEIGDIEIISDG